MDIAKIPTIMRANKMPIGAALMDSWFARAPAIKPKYGIPDMTTVTMKWIRGFPHADAVLRSIVADELWATAPSQGELVKVLTRAGLIGRVGSGGQSDFGVVGVPMSVDMKAIHPDHVNHRVVERGAALDDLMAALANFAFYVAVAGRVFDIGGARSRIEIRKVGIYAMDSYDFEGWQPLGYWNETTNAVSTRNPFVGDYVDNGSFRDWRTAHLKGGDYEVFSDIEEVALRRPFSFDSA